ncbi:MAG: retron St85 family RNA-directed DNA polymerase [Spirochaetales bacterium]|nr:retron St85 family RNA-directed DNA polymerase [Spirochaetales bacterium]
MSYKEKIIKDLYINNDLYEEFQRISQIKIKKFKLEKKSGGYRYIHSPDARIKLIQYWLIDNVLKSLPIHPAAYAFKKNTSILDNAKRHSKNKYYLTIDFIDFFHSIKFIDFLNFSDNYNISKNSEIFTDELLNIIRKFCFYNDVLPIGYTSSPIISNILMYDFDQKITEYIKQKKGVVYSRYADDIVISTNKKNESIEIYRDIKKIIYENVNPKLLINFKKVKFLSSTSGSAYVTGLKINPHKQVSISKKKKDHIRLLLSIYKKKGLSDEERKSLSGHLSYIKYVEPKFYTKLQEKYFVEIDKIYKTL